MLLLELLGLQPVLKPLYENLLLIINKLQRQKIRFSTFSSGLSTKNNWRERKIFPFKRKKCIFATAKSLEKVAEQNKKSLEKRARFQEKSLEKRAQHQEQHIINH